MILSRSYFLILSNRFSDTFFNILGVFSATRNYKWFFNKKKEIDFDEFWSSIKNYFFLIQKKKWKIWGVILVENIFWYQELFFISKIIFRDQEFELLISFFIFCNIPTCNASSDWKTFAYRRQVFSFLSSSVMATKRFALSARTNLQAMGEK